MLVSGLANWQLFESQKRAHDDPHDSLGAKCTSDPGIENIARRCTIGSPPGVVLSVYVSIVGGSSELTFLHAFLDEISRQKINFRWEIIIGTADLDVFRLITGHQAYKLQKMLTATTVLLKEDRGLYETWDTLIGIANGQFLTNWNIDDRKSPYSLQKRVQALLTNDDLDVVSSPVYVSRDPHATWETRQKLPCMYCEVAGEFYGISSFVRTNRENGALNLREVHNYPHNAPIYRRELHFRFGTFSGNSLSDGPAYTCSDWRFWVRLARAHRRFYQFQEPNEIYYVRAESFSHRNDTGSVPCLEETVTELEPLGLYNNLDWAGYEAKNKRKNVVIVCSNFPSNYEPRGLQVTQLAEWLSDNDAIVTFVATSASSTCDASFLEKGINCTSAPSNAIMSMHLSHQIGLADILFIMDDELCSLRAFLDVVSWSSLFKKLVLVGRHCSIDGREERTNNSKLHVEREAVLTSTRTSHADEIFLELTIPNIPRQEYGVEHYSFTHVVDPGARGLLILRWLIQDAFPRLTQSSGLAPVSLQIIAPCFIEGHFEELVSGVVDYGLHLVDVHPHRFSGASRIIHTLGFSCADNFLSVLKNTTIMLAPALDESEENVWNANVYGALVNGFKLVTSRHYINHTPCEGNKAELVPCRYIKVVPSIEENAFAFTNASVHLANTNSRSLQENYSSYRTDMLENFSRKVWVKNQRLMGLLDSV